jgi:hypothetical protein
MDGQIADFNHTFRNITTPEQEKYTHINYGETPSTRVIIRDEKIPKFWTDYCQAVANNNKKLFISERISKHSPIIVNIDITFSEEEEEKNVPNCWNFIMEVVQNYQIVISELFTIGPEETYIDMCAVLSAENTVLQDGAFLTSYRLIFPYTRVDTAYHSKYILPRVFSKCRATNTLSKLPHHTPTDWPNILKIPKISVPLYGSRETAEYSRLLFEKIVPSLRSTDLEEGIDDIEYLELDKVIEITNHQHFAKELIHEAALPNRPVQHWLPIFLSVDYWPSFLQTRVSPTASIGNTGGKYGLDNKEEVSIIESLLGMLSETRANCSWYWMDVGRAIHYTYRASPQGLQQWANFTKKKSKTFTAKDCEEVYSRLNFNSYVTHKTIGWYAKQDRPEDYEVWHKRWVQPALEAALVEYNKKFNHADVAHLLYKMYWMDYVYVEKSSWYEFRNNGWRESKEGLCLSKRILEPNGFIKFLEVMRADCSRRVAELDDQNQKVTYETKNASLTKLIFHMKTDAFNKSVRRFSQHFFHCDYFMGQLDKNPNLCRQNNGYGVLECFDSKCINRPGKPEDYITKSLGCHLHMEYSMKHTAVELFMKWMFQLFINKAMVDFFLKSCASLVKGRNVQKWFLIFSGSLGDNAKSIIVKLLQKTFGVYAVTLDPSALATKKGNSSGPNPELARLNGARVVILNETDDKDDLRSNIIKRLTGGDSFFARNCGADGGEVDSQFKTILVCNNLPALDPSDKALKNRVLNFPFISRWVYDAPTTEAEQMKKRLFKRDDFFEDKMDDYVNAFLWLIVNVYYEKYILEGLNKPKEVEEATRNYWSEFDIYKNFMDDYMEPSKKEGETANVLESYKMFVEWYRSMMPGKNPPVGSVFIREMTNRLGVGAPENKCWKNCKLKVDVMTL